MTQFSAAFFIQAIKDNLLKKYRADKIEKLLYSLSCFNVEPILSDLPLDIDPTLAVVHNLICRGLPTRMSLNLEKKFIDAFGFFSENEYEKSQGAIGYILDGESERYFEALHVIDPRWDRSSRKYSLSWEKLGSEYEDDFLFKSLPKYSGTGDFIIQLIEMQRSITSILENRGDPEKLPEILQQNFRDQVCDFSIEFAYPIENKNGIVIEVDGRQHKPVNQGGTPGQYELDIQRDIVVEKAKWLKTLRIPTDQWDNLESALSRFRELVSDEYFQNMKRNFENKIFDDERLDILQLTLSPIAIGRIQKTLIELIIRNVLDLKKTVWKIAIVERDVPCGYLAIEGFQELFDNLLGLQKNPNIRLPNIEIQTYCSEEFFFSKLNQPYGNNLKLISETSNDQNEYDLMIDISVLLHEGLASRDTHLNYRNYVEIRSVQSIQSKRTFYTAEPIIYAEILKKGKIVYKQITDREKHLRYFLQAIFRKENFREGQVKILDRALRQKNVITRLPTGAGKSLTYQLAGLLQPGIVLVVDPLVSLMRDQDHNLRKNGIDSTTFINRTINPKERDRRCNLMAEGHFQFVFISPERLQIKEFRDYLKSMKNHYFSYCVIDEAHCVSEWGHDFRTSYLRLGENARQYCHTFNKHLTILGLTGTASYDVLSDVQKELDINDETAIVDPEKYERRELKFAINDVGEPNVPTNADGFAIKAAVSVLKLEKLYQIIENLPLQDRENGEECTSLKDFFFTQSSLKNAGIVFCPHKSENSPFGVKRIYGSLLERFPELNNITGKYHGSSNSDENDDTDFGEIQDCFINDELLLMISTNALGMGIDKSNIRFTVHYNMPQSIEAFYQEAGRAGRDRKIAHCHVLYSPFKIHNNDEEISVDKSLMLSFHHNSFPGAEKEKRVLNELLDEISYPDEYTIDKINEEISEEFDEDIRLKIWFGDYLLRDGTVHKRLYINGNEYPKGYGYIDLRTERLVAEEGQDKMILQETESLKIIEKTYQVLRKKKDPNKSFLEWVIWKKSIGRTEGIERKIARESSTSITIPFISKEVQDIINLWDDRDMAFDEDLVLKAYPYTTSSEEFIKSLNGKYYRKTGRWLQLNQIQTTSIKKLYPFIRDQNDTFKAVYRLSIIGIIDDYSVDYKSKTIIAKISKKTKEDYLYNLTRYIGRYVTEEVKKKVDTNVFSDSTDEETPLKKCCNYLIDFVYSTIAKKRRMAIDSMENAIKNGVDGGNFAERINTYFDSKYIPDLRPFTLKYSIDTVWDFMKITKGEPNEISHLRGACDRLLEVNPENAAFLILRAFSGFLIPNYDKQSTVMDFRNGWKILREIKEWSRIEYLEHFSHFYRILVDYNQNIKHYLDLEIMNEHKSWLKEFNNNFLKGMDYDGK